MRGSHSGTRACSQAARARSQCHGTGAQHGGARRLGGRGHMCQRNVGHRQSSTQAAPTTRPPSRRRHQRRDRAGRQQGEAGERRRDRQPVPDERRDIAAAVGAGLPLQRQEGVLDRVVDKRPAGSSGQSASRRTGDRERRVPLHRHVPRHAATRRHRAARHSASYPKPFTCSQARPCVGQTVGPPVIVRGPQQGRWAVAVQEPAVR
jgi:hypothetical protein